MGFWNIVGRVLQGKVAFEVPTDDTLESGESEYEPLDVAGSDSMQDGASAGKVIPKIVITRCQSYIKGDNLEVWAWIRNEASTPIRLERMMMIGVNRRLGNFLTPGEQEQVQVYSGPRPTISSYKVAELHYMQVNTNDYFCAEHEIGYDYRSDGTYTVEGLRAYNYVRDT